MNANTLLDFFNQLGKNQQSKVAGLGNTNAGAAATNGGPSSVASSTSSSAAAMAAAASRVSVKEEPLSEEDIRALQKDRQKKDNHNMSKF